MYYVGLDPYKMDVTGCVLDSQGTGVLGALATVVWLLVKGVDEQRWKGQANAAKASIGP